jgi:hypothetical protein
MLVILVTQVEGRKIEDQGQPRQKISKTPTLISELGMVRQLCDPSYAGDGSRK